MKRATIASLLAALTCAAPAFAGQITLIPAGASWNYLDNGSNQGTAWKEPSFNDSTWKTGLAELGYGDASEGRPEATVISYGSNSSAKYITTYFRHSFSVADTSAITSLQLHLVRDDGAVVYLNGAPVYTNNMPSGTISYTTLASTAIGGADEATFYQASIPANLLVNGVNTIAVEMHQSGATSTDLSFDLKLTAADSALVTRGPYLQIGTPNSVLVRWRTDVAVDSVVRYGLSENSLDQVVSTTGQRTEHEVKITGLQPDTRYYYSVGTSAQTLASGPTYYYVTQPLAGTPSPTRIWVLGDSGTGTINQFNVRDAYAAYDPARYTDVWLMLGDNVYETGTDVEYQTRLFDVYSGFLRNTVLWPTVGNHDTASSEFPSPTIPYYQSFSMPKAAEAGGVASGSEAYYSFDHGNIHFICLDSMSRDSRKPGSAMLQWLTNDLSQVTAKWLIAFWHHPPYSKGHDSDAEYFQIEMRENVVPVLEQYGVDLVLSGHSHAYERSFLLDGHYGHSSTLSSTMIKDGNSGNRDSVTGPYNKPTSGLNAHEGSVYVVAGSSGKVNNYAGITNGVGHPAMYISVEELGSLVIDVSGNELRVKFLRDNRQIRDDFSITKGPVVNELPTVQVTSPTEGATFAAHSNVELTANAADLDGVIASVSFYVDSALVGTVNSAPFSFVWNNATPGQHVVAASATDNDGGVAVSSNVNITVDGPVAPNAPSGLAANAISSTQVKLDWTDNSNNEDKFVVLRSEDGAIFAPVANVAANITTFVDSGLSPSTLYYYSIQAENSAGTSEASAVSSASTLPAPPTAPSQLAATSTATEVSLTWIDNSDSETNFKVYRASGASSFTLVGTVYPNGTYFIDTAVTPATLYNYRVVANNDGGDSAPAETSISTLPLPPNSPTTLTATAGNGQATLNWSASAGASSYTVKRSTVSGGPYTVIASGLSTPSYLNTGLVNATTYYYVVTASNSGGESGNSPQASVTPNAPPVAPSNLKAVAVSKSQINLTWTDNSNNESGFKIERSNALNGAYTQIGTAIANATSFNNNSGLTGGKTYYYRVRAYNAQGDSAYSNTISATTPKK